MIANQIKWRIIVGIITAIVFCLGFRVFIKHYLSFQDLHVSVINRLEEPILGLMSVYDQRGSKQIRIRLLGPIASNKVFSINETRAVPGKFDIKLEFYKCCPWKEAHTGLYRTEDFLVDQALAPTWHRDGFSLDIEVTTLNDEIVINRGPW